MHIGITKNSILFKPQALYLSIINMKKHYKNMKEVVVREVKFLTHLVGMTLTPSYLDIVLSARHALSTKLDVDGVGSHHLGRKQDAERSVWILHDVDIDVVTAGAADATGDLTITGLGGIHTNHGLLVHRDSCVLQTICLKIEITNLTL